MLKAQVIPILRRVIRATHLRKINVHVHMLTSRIYHDNEREGHQRFTKTSGGINFTGVGTFSKRNSLDDYGTANNNLSRDEDNFAGRIGLLTGASRRLRFLFFTPVPSFRL